MLIVWIAGVVLSPGEIDKAPTGGAHVVPLEAAEPPGAAVMTPTDASKATAAVNPNIFFNMHAPLAVVRYHPRVTRYTGEAGGARAFRRPPGAGADPPIRSIRSIRACSLVYCRPHADVAQLVEHNLAKVGVAGSNPVVRSKSESDL